MNDLPVRMARLSARHLGRAIAGWLHFVALCLGAGSVVGGNPATGEDFRIGEAGRSEAMAAEGGLERKSLEHVLITAPPGKGRLDATAAGDAARDVSGRMRA